jgi:hypothetical protein
MPNGGSHHCANCKYFDNGLCTLRQTRIRISHWTTCKNWNSELTEPSGPIFAIVCQVKNGAGSYADIPYFKGNRVDTYQEGSKDTIIKFKDGDGNIIELPDIESYLKYYEENA